MTDAKLILTDELHDRLHVQARNLLFEYRLSPEKVVPVDIVEKLMRLYGELIAQLIFEDQEKARKQQENKTCDPSGLLAGRFLHIDDGTSVTLAIVDGKTADAENS
jgi:hypothetical protein